MPVSIIFARTDEKKEGWIQFQDGKRQGFQTPGFTFKSNKTGIDDMASTLTVSLYLNEQPGHYNEKLQGSPGGAEFSQESNS